MRDLNAELKMFLKQIIAAGEDPQMIEDEYAKILDRFMDTYRAEGETPREYLDKLYKKGELPVYIQKNIDSIPDGCGDVYIKGDVLQLKPLLVEPATRKFVLEILHRGERSELNGDLIGLAATFDADEREAAAEILKSDEKARDMLMDLAKNADGKALAVYIDFLMAFENKTDVFALIKKVFSEDVVLYAYYLGKIEEDSREIISFLNERLKENVNYIEFMEIRNSIERLGGEVDETPDFNDDHYYRIIKGKQQNDNS